MIPKHDQEHGQAEYEIYFEEIHDGIFDSRKEKIAYEDFRSGSSGHTFKSMTCKDAATAESNSSQQQGRKQQDSVKVALHHRRIPMSDLSTLKQYYKLADQLIEKVSKDDLAQCARLLALNVAHYQSKYGELPLDEKLAMIGMTKPNEEQIQLLINGTEIFVGVLGNVVAGIGQERH